MHQWLCSSNMWARGVEKDYLPWALDSVGLSGDVLEIGPGYGATTRVLAQKSLSLTALEIDPELAASLQARVNARVRVVTGDGSELPFESAAFSGVVCFTMLHHVKSVALQDRLFAETFRVLQPGGVFAGADSLVSFGFKLLHLRDTMVPVNPSTLPGRLEAAGFRDVTVETSPHGAFKFRAYKQAQ